MPFEIFDSSADDLNSDLLAEEANWPEELAMLGAQLSADAARLAALYPASERVGRSTTDAAATATPARKWTLPSVIRHVGHAANARWIAAASIVAVASLATYFAYPSSESGAIADHDSMAAVQVVANVDAGAAMPQDAMLFEETGFENLSSPAQEALLDLFEDDQLAQASLSI